MAKPTVKDGAPKKNLMLLGLGGGAPKREAAEPRPAKARELAEAVAQGVELESPAPVLLGPRAEEETPPTPLAEKSESRSRVLIEARPSQRPSKVNAKVDPAEAPTERPKKKAAVSAPKEPRSSPRKDERPLSEPGPFITTSLVLTAEQHQTLGLMALESRRPGRKAELSAVIRDVIAEYLEGKGDAAELDLEMPSAAERTKVTVVVGDDHWVELQRRARMLSKPRERVSASSIVRALLKRKMDGEWGAGANTRSMSSVRER